MVKDDYVKTQPKPIRHRIETVFVPVLKEDRSAVDRIAVYYTDTKSTAEWKADGESWTPWLQVNASARSLEDVGAIMDSLHVARAQLKHALAEHESEK